MKYQPTDERELQELFNRLRIWERCQEGELAVEVLKRMGWKRKRGALKGTRWEYWSFYDPRTGHEVARTGQHVKRNGDLGASGLPDPKQVFHGGVLYVLSKPTALADL